MAKVSSEASSAEPNLTPLLDLVLQLVMFFMITVNFVTQDVNEDIKLPESQSARPMDKSETDVLFLNLKPFNTAEFKTRLSTEALERLQEKFREGDPTILVVSKEPMRMLETKYWLKQQYEDAKRNSKDGKVNTAIVIRAHRDTDYGQVYQLLQMCKTEGYRSFKVRAMTKAAAVAH